MDGKVDPLQKYIASMCKKVDFNTSTNIMQMEWKGGTTAAMETTSNSPLTESGISTATSASMLSCASQKRGMKNK